MRSSHRSLRLPARRTRSTVPPVACIVCAASFGRPATASLNATCTVNLPWPLCSAGA